MPINPTNPGYILLMCSKTWPHIIYWNGTAPTALAIGESPANVFSLATYQNCTVAAIDNSNSLFYSNPGDPLSWPSDNELVIDTKWGKITGLVGQDDKIIIFCQKGILYLSGDLIDDPHVGILHPEIGAMPGTIAQYGSSVVFVFGQNLYTLDGSVSLMSDAIRDSLGATPDSHVALNDEYVYVRPARESGQTSDVFVFEKLRFGFWSRQTYPTSTGVGSLNPPQGIVQYIAYPWDCFALPGGNGNLYVQPLFDQNAAIGSTDIHADSGTAYPTLSKLQTRFLDFGDRVLTKQFRRGMIYGEGTDIKVQLYFLDKNKVETMVEPELSSFELPCQFTVPIADGTDDSPPTEFQEVSMYIEGKDLLIQHISFDFRPIRYNLLSF